MNRIIKLMVLLLTVASGGAARAAVLFSEDFSDNSPSPNMALGAGFGTPATSFTGAFTVTSGDGNRIYLGTDDSDYNGGNFVYEATVVMSAAANPWASAFFGMGNADATGGSGEPGNPNLLLIIRPDVPSNFFGGRDNGATSTTGPQFASAGTTDRLRMTWDATTQIGTFEIDMNYAGGPFVATPGYTFTLNGGDNGFNATNSRLILGGGDGVSFDDILVVPEPASAALVSAGGLALGLRRARRRA